MTTSSCYLISLTLDFFICVPSKILFETINVGLKLSVKNERAVFNLFS
jgi:hypothetical protein